MNIKQLIIDDKAVSPVIGVILMVAITVILAAVIGTFVLGIGQDQQATPQGSFNFEFQPEGGDGSSGDDDSLVVTQEGGDSFNTENANTVTLSACNSGATGWLATESDDEITAGDSYTVAEASSSVSGDCTGTLNSDTTVRVLWESNSGDESQSVASFTVPN